MATSTESAASPASPIAHLSWGDIARHLRQAWLSLLVVPLLCGALAFAASFLLKPKFLATTSFLPPQQQSQGLASSALAALGSLTGVGSAVRTPADQYVSLMQSVTVLDRVIDKFNLMAEYDVPFKQQARKLLLSKVQMSVGKKDGLISVAVEDTVPQRAADVANQFVQELRQVTNHLAVTEAQQRRMFFEKQLLQTRDQLNTAQKQLQGSGFDPGALRSEPKAAAEGYGKLRAESVAAEVRLQVLRGRLAESSPEVQQQAAVVRALRDQLGREERPTAVTVGPDYVGRYREFKYQEALFEIYARQFELARVDESREGAVIQVVDAAQAPELRFFPRRAFMAATVTAAAFVLALLLALLRMSRSAGPEVSGTAGGAATAS